MSKKHLSNSNKKNPVNMQYSFNEELNQADSPVEDNITSDNSVSGTLEVSPIDSNEEDAQVITVDSILKDDSDTDKMAEFLEEDVTEEKDDLFVPEKTDDEQMTFFESDSGKYQEPPIPFSKIKNVHSSEKFETPYLYNTKNGERIRYRLSLPNEKNPRRRRLVKNVLSMISTIVIALILALLIRNYVFVIALVDGPSMQPTLHTDERLFVTRYTYYFNDIQRGDIVVCKYPSPEYPKKYVKRVIALGGETISIFNGVVYINGDALQEDYIKDPPLNDMEEQYVPEGYVFVMGDNRNNSADSRKPYIGPIPENYVLGKAQCIIFPFSKFGTPEEKQ